MTTRSRFNRSTHAPPVFATAPTIVGTPQIGIASSYASGSVSGFPAPSIAQQWTLDGADIAGATGATYTPISGDAAHALRVREIASNNRGTASSTSAPVGVISGSGIAPSFSSAPAIIGIPQVGVASSYTPGTVSGSPTPTITQQWTLDGADIVGAIGATYTPISGDAAHALRVREIATNASGSANSTSVPATVSSAASAPSFSTAPAILGTPQVGVPSSYTPGTVSGSPSPTITQQWTRDGADIGGATGATYTPISGDSTHALRVREIATNASGSANSTSAPGTVLPAASGGTITQLGTQTLSQFITQVRTALPEGLSAANSRMLPSSGLIAFCGATIWRDKYSLGIGGGHGDSCDDGHYAQDLATGVWELKQNPSTAGGGSATVDYTVGEYTSLLNGRPASQHSYMHLVTVQDDIVQGYGYAIGSLAGASKQAHRWKGSLNGGLGAWERFGTGSFAANCQYAVCYDTRRDRIVRFASETGNLVGWIPAGGSTVPWTDVVVSGQPGFTIYWNGVGYHQALDCFVLVSQNGLPNRVWTLPGDLSGGWTEVTVAGTAPIPMTNGGLEYIPPMQAFASANSGLLEDPTTYPPEPNKLYYLTPTGGTRTGTWTWTQETFTSTATIAPWGASGAGPTQSPNGLLRWSSLLNGIVMVKSAQYLTEVFTPSAVTGGAAADWAARSTAPGVVVAYDFSALPANGGTHKWGSLKASPHITCYQQNDVYYGTQVVVDNAVAPPGSTGSLRFDVADCPSGITLPLTGSVGGATSGTLTQAYADGTYPATFSNAETRTVTIVGAAISWSGALSSGSVLSVTLTGQGSGERGDLWWISIDDYADQFGDNAEFWVQWRCRMNDSYATFLYGDSGGGLTGYKQLMLGEGMRTDELIAVVDPAWPFGYRGPGTSISQNQIQGVRVDFEGETNLIGTAATDGSYAANHGWKYPSSYHGKPGYAGLNTNGTDVTKSTSHNSGIETDHVAACQYSVVGGIYTDKSTCFAYPVDQWFTMMVHVKLGARGHGFSSIPFGYQNVDALRVSSTQIKLPNSYYSEHFGVNSGGRYLRIRGSVTGTIEGLITAKAPFFTVNFTSDRQGATSGTLTAPITNGTYRLSFPADGGDQRIVTVTGGTSASWSGALSTGSPITKADDDEALVTLSGLTGSIASEALLVDEFDNGFQNSTIEYYGALAGAPLALLHKRTGVVMRNGNYTYNDVGYSPIAKYGTFAWTTFMTSKSLTQTHPMGKVWVSQIIIKSGATPPASPAY